METSFAYSIPYVLFAFSLGLLALFWHYGDDRAKRWSVIGSITLFLFFIGLRGLIMSDWAFYYYFFRDHCTWSEIFNLGQVENYEKISLFFGLSAWPLFPQLFSSLQQMRSTNTGMMRIHMLPLKVPY